MKYSVHMRSTPGFYEQYSGEVKVSAENEKEAIDRAFQKLKTGAFRDRSRNMWEVVKVECIGY